MADAIPEGMFGLIPHLVVDDAAAAIDFYKQAFDAEEVSRAPAPDGERLMHAAIRIDGDVLFLADDFPEMNDGKSATPKAFGGTPIGIQRYVVDVDAAVAQAEAAGAKVTMPPEDMFWGDRFASVEDPFGHSWSLATHIRDMTPEEMAAAGAEAFAQMQ